ncbi:MAG: hypothetical protein P8076_07155 [Gammaproteobacteria bacterium]
MKKSVRRLCVAAVLAIGIAQAVSAADGPRAALLAQYQRILPELTRNSFGVPVFVRSTDDGDVLSADVFGVIERPPETVAEILGQPRAWCQFVPLTLNVKACTYTQYAPDVRLTLFMGRKYYEPPEKAYQVRYRFTSNRTRDGVFRVALYGGDGPLGTEDYRIEVEATAVGAGTLVHIRCSYRPSTRSRWATAAYLATLGRDKVGFSRVGVDADGKPLLVGGVRGIIERNVMRYYLALAAVLDTRTVPLDGRFEARIRRWFDLTERYPAQLHELDRTEYLQAKRREHRNQERLQAVQTAALGPGS